MSYCVIISSASLRNTTTFNSINSNNYIMDTTKLFGKIGKRDFRKKLGYWVIENSNRNFQVSNFGYPNVSVRVRFTILPTQNSGYPNGDLFCFGYLNHDHPYEALYASCFVVTFPFSLHSTTKLILISCHFGDS